MSSGDSRACSGAATEASNQRRMKSREFDSLPQRNGPVSGNGRKKVITGVCKVFISGGCEVYAEGTITLVPVNDERTKVLVDNSGEYFYDGSSQTASSFEIEIDAGEASAFVGTCKKLAGSEEGGPDLFSTRNAKVTLDFALQGGDFHFSGDEDRDWYPLDPLIEAIEAFVASCLEKANTPSELPSGNQTEAFLGNPGERAEAQFLLYDMSGLFGGRMVSMTGRGNVAIQTVSRDPEKNRLWEREYFFDLPSEHVERIVGEIIDDDPLSIQLEDRMGVPDEVRIRFSITNSKKESFSLEDWERSSLHPDTDRDHPRKKFDRICHALKRLEHLAKTEKEPVNEGPYGAK